MLSVFMLAFLLRLGWMGTYFGQDEVYYVGYANDIVNSRPYTSAYSPLFYYFLAPFTILFNNSEILFHVLMAFLGALNVAILYYIGRKFVNRNVGMIAAILLMFSTTHWFFSDFAMLDMPVALFSTIAFYFYWSGYSKKSSRNLILAVLFGSVATLTKYGFFASVAMLGYMVLFDRKSLMNKKLILSIMLPFIMFGLWMAYFIGQQGWLWSWWSNYVQGGTGLSSPFYQYFAATWYEFLLPIPALFVIFTSLYLIAKQKIKHKHLWTVFLAAFVVSSLSAFYTALPLEHQAVLGISALVLSSLVLVNNKFYRYVVLYTAAVFIFYSMLGLKFPRYILPALPGLYLIVAGLMNSVWKNKIYAIVSIAVLVVFAVFNSIDTISKLTLDQQINTVKHQAQQYIIDNSQSCGKVYSKTWYGFYYLRTRITDLPGDVASLDCSCQPSYYVSEGMLDSRYASQLQKEQEFTGSSVQYAIGPSGFKTYTTILTPIEVYSTKPCSSQS